VAVDDSVLVAVAVCDVEPEAVVLEEAPALLLPLPLALPVPVALLETLDEALPEGDAVDEGLPLAVALAEALVLPLDVAVREADCTGQATSSAIARLPVMPQTERRRRRGRVQHARRELGGGRTDAGLQRRTRQPKRVRKDRITHL
jgi:hypothetical protein